MARRGVKKFKFVSPGVFIDEIDESQLPGEAPPVGPVVIGRFERGPQMRPTMVGSFSEFVDVFGLPIPGGKGGDIWRDGNYTAPTYAAYAAQAWLRNGSPITVVRLAGHQHSKTDTNAVKAGWKTDNGIEADNTGGGAYGLFLHNSASLGGPDGMKATATIKVISATAGDYDTPQIEFTLISNDASNTSKTYQFADGTSVANGAAITDGDDEGKIRIAVTGMNTRVAIAAAIAEAINADDGHGTGDLLVAASDGVDTVTVTQGAVGESGNTSIDVMENADINVLTINDVITASSFVNGGNVGNGVLAAIFYLNEGSIKLEGVNPVDGTALAGTAAMIRSSVPNEWEVSLYDSNGNAKDKSKFNFDDTTDKYIRKVFNTNPTLTNNDITDTDYRKTYWLGETFERSVKENVSTSANTLGVILGLGSGSVETEHHGNYELGAATPGRTGWFFSQDLTTNTAAYKPEDMQKLFRLIALDDAEWAQRNLKVSIQDLKASTNPSYPYGTFSVVIRSISDSDKSVRIVERFSNCEMNPNSPNYIGRKIGDKYVVWDDTESRYREYGDFTNLSRYMYVEVNPEVAAGATDARYMPFGVYGPLRFSGFTLTSGSASPRILGSVTNDNFAYLKGGAAIANTAGDASNFVSFGPGVMEQSTCSYVFPAPQLRISASHQSLSSPKSAYFGVDTTVYSENRTAVRYEKSVPDILRPLPAGTPSARSFDSPTTGSGAGTHTSGYKSEYSFIFSLDNIGTGSSTDDQSARYKAGLRAAGDSYTAVSGNYNEVLDQGFNRFTTCFHGGYDGTNLREKDPFRDGLMSGNDNDKNSYIFYSIKKAIDAIADPEVLEMNLVAMPGIRQPELTQHLINVCEERADAMAIVDMNGGYEPSTNPTDVSKNTEQDRVDPVAVNTIINNIQSRGLNSSYAATYWPWVQIQDTIKGAVLWAPPSVAALGALAFSEKNAELWFAPAGFNRGGISGGAAGIPVVGVRQRLTSEERDKLYDANINPIASFPSEGIVIFGQKTLQLSASALDRINVRRLMIFLKKQISRISASMLFEQNVEATWQKFISQVTPILASVKARLGLADYKLVLDKTTTTPDLVDRNVVYAKIFLKPVKAIEFIALDFIITDQGASFED